MWTMWSLRAVFRDEFVSIIVRLVYPGILGRSEWSVFEAICAAVCLVAHILWHAIEEVWSLPHEASFSDWFDRQL